MNAALADLPISPTYRRCSFDRAISSNDQSFSLLGLYGFELSTFRASIFLLGFLPDFPIFVLQIFRPDKIAVGVKVKVDLLRAKEFRRVPVQPGFQSLTILHNIL